MPLLPEGATSVNDQAQGDRIVPRFLEIPWIDRSVAHILGGRYESLRVFHLKSYPIEIPPVGRNDITPVMLSAAKRSRNIPHSDWTIIFPDYS
jgi:hypothetical protein